jgi:ABC-2 type transport system ATP-binding protein
MRKELTFFILVLIIAVGASAQELKIEIVTPRISVSDLSACLLRNLIQQGSQYLCSSSNNVPEVNENVVLIATISNSGLVAATGVNVKFFVNGEEMTGCTATGNIDGGNSATSTCFMSFHAAGTYTVKVEATCTMCETGYETASKTVAITASAAPTVVAVTITASATPTVVVGQLARISAELSASNTAPVLGESVTLTATITNYGQRAATGVAVKFLVDGTKKTECADSVNIASGGSVTRTCTVMFDRAGTYTAKVDATCATCGTGYTTYTTQEGVSITASAATVATTPAATATPTETPTTVVLTPSPTETPTPGVLGSINIYEIIVIILVATVGFGYVFKRHAGRPKPERQVTVEEASLQPLEEKRARLKRLLNESDEKFVSGALSETEHTELRLNYLKQIEALNEEIRRMGTSKPVIDVSRIITVKGLMKSYKGTVILENVEFDVKEKTLCGIIGTSGGGKSTIIESIAGRITPDAGNVTVMGKDASANRDEVNKIVGFVPQHPELHLDQTVWGNMKNSAIKWGVKDFEKKSETILKQVGILERKDLIAKNLSGGQLKRLSLGMELMRDPPILILDEPTTGLDPSGRDQILSILSNLVSTGKRTVLFTTHFMDEAEHCDDVIIVGDGRILAKGAPSDLAKKVPGRGKIISVTLEEISDDLFSRISKMSNIQKIVREGRILRIIMDNPDPVEVPHKIKELGGKVEEAKIDKTGMKEVFVYYTGIHPEDAK